MTNEFYEYVKKYIADKLELDKNYVRYSYYDLRVNQNLSEGVVNDFLRCSKKLLEGLGFNVYFTGARFKYQGAARVAESNEYMIAIKDGE
mgnify:FL=1